MAEKEDIYSCSFLETPECGSRTGLTAKSRVQLFCSKETVDDFSSVLWHFLAVIILIHIAMENLKTVNTPDPDSVSSLCPSHSCPPPSLASGSSERQFDLITPIHRNEERYISIPRELGALPHSVFTLLDQYKTEYTCTGCRKRECYKAVVCEICQEYQYCSLECLDRYNKHHLSVCLYIGFKKRRGVFRRHSTIKEALGMLSLAKTLDDDGDIPLFDLLTKSHPDHVDHASAAKSYIQSLCYEAATCNGNGTRVSILEAHLSQLNKIRNGPLIYFQAHSKFAPETCHKIIIAMTKYHVDHGSFGHTSDNDDDSSDSLLFGQGWWTSSLQTRDKPSNTDHKERNRFSLTKQQTEGQFLNGFNYDSDSDDNADETENGPVKVKKDPHNLTDKYKVNKTAGGSHQKSVDSGPQNALVPAREGSVQRFAALRNMRTLKFETGTEHCGLCQKQASNMKVCARCRFVAYCSKKCQVEHFPLHKQICKTQALFRDVIGRIPQLVTHGLISKYPESKITCYYLEIPDELNFFGLWNLQIGSHFLGQIVNVETDLFLPHVRMVTLKDCENQQVLMLLKIDELYSRFHIPGFGEPVAVDHCLTPGNFILTANCVWSILLNCIAGKLVEDCFFILNN